MVTKATELGAPLTDEQTANCKTVYLRELTDAENIDVDQDLYDMTMKQVTGLADAAALKQTLGMIGMMAGGMALQAAAESQ